MSDLQSQLPDNDEATTGIGHTRWATHGKPSDENAHPHTDCNGEIAVVHNGIIENYAGLREELQARGHVFTSETDTEVIAHLVEENYDGDLAEAVRAVLPEFKGSYALVVVHRGERERLVAARRDSPLLVGIGDKEVFLASDATAFLAHTRRVVYLNDGDMVNTCGGTLEVTDASGRERDAEISKIEWDLETAERAGYPHYMLKEINEQPRSLRNTISSRTVEMTGRVSLDTGLDDDLLINVQRAVIVACGTSYHAGLVGRHYLKELAGLPAAVEHASEFRYSGPLVDSHTLVIAISQSGETADTLAALREAKSMGCPALAICNVVGSTLTREAEGVLYTRSGPEIGVAATKTFTSQVVSLLMLALHLSTLRRALPASRAKQLVTGLRSLPGLVQRLLDDTAVKIEEIAAELSHARTFFFIGRGLDYAVALEGALKMKEISYIPSEGCPGGELKHGPLALVEEGVPVVAIVPGGRLREKMQSNIKEVKAREAMLVALVTADDRETSKFVDRVIKLPHCNEFLIPVLSSVVVQLLAYYVARDRGLPIDRPRNLAKSVTVE
jgi:glucosamine--fructose-6-phosphate aminotransferase (isomerizing)